MSFFRFVPDFLRCLKDERLLAYPLIPNEIKLLASIWREFANIGINHFATCAFLMKIRKLHVPWSRAEIFMHLARYLSDHKIRTSCSLRFLVEALEVYQSQVPPFFVFCVFAILF